MCLRHRVKTGSRLVIVAARLLQIVEDIVTNLDKISNVGDDICQNIRCLSIQGPQLDPLRVQHFGVDLGIGNSVVPDQSNSKILKKKRNND